MDYVAARVRGRAFARFTMACAAIDSGDKVRVKHCMFDPAVRDLAKKVATTLRCESIVKIMYYYFICPPTIAGDSTNILLNFTIHDANAIGIYIYTLRRLLSVLYQSNVSSNVIMCLTTSCVSNAMLYARIQSSIQTLFVLRYFSSSKNPSPSCSWKYLSYPSKSLFTECFSTWD